MNDIKLDLTAAKQVLVKVEYTRNGWNCVLTIGDEMNKLQVKIKEDDLQSMDDMSKLALGYSTYSELEDGLVELKMQKEKLEETIQILKEKIEHESR